MYSMSRRPPSPLIGIVLASAVLAMCIFAMVRTVVLLATG